MEALVGLIAWILLGVVVVLVVIIVLLLIVVGAMGKFAGDCLEAFWKGF